MMNVLHLSAALNMLDSGRQVSLRVVLRDGSVAEMRDVVSLRHDFVKGTRRVKFLRSGQIRLIHDCCIIGINDFEVFM